MESLFSSLFPAANKSAWLQQVEKELKGAAAYESLRWHTPDGFTLEPYYTASDVDQLPLATIQAAQKQNPSWLNAPERTISDEKTDNAALRDFLSRGADALVLELTGQPDLSHLLNGIKLSDTPVFFRFDSAVSGIQASEIVRDLQTIAPYQLKGGLLTNGENGADVTRLTANSPQFMTVCASSHQFHQAGATATQELAFTLASLADTYDTLTDAGLTVGELVPKTMFSMSIGPGYFPEIAKLRVLRVLISRFLSAYDSSFDASTHPLQRADSSFVHAQTSTRFDTTDAPYTNLIRASTEAMAAVIGGCDMLTVHPYDTVLGPSADPAFSERIARNVSVLLKEESYLDKVADPAAGSYYIEKLTHQLAESAWTLFLDIESRGGLAKATRGGFVQEELRQL